LNAPAPDLKAVHFTAPVEWIGAAKGERPKTFRMRAYNGGQLRVDGFTLPIVVDLAGLNAKEQRRPILRDHDLDRIVGHSERIAVGAASVDLEGRVSENGDAAKEVLARASEGFPWQASIGADVLGKVEHVKVGDSVVVNGQKFAGPLLVARTTALREASFVALGADDGSWATIAARKEREMDGAATTPTAEALRIESIHALCGDDNAPLAVQAIREGWSAEKAEIELLKKERDTAKLDAMRSGRPTGPALHAARSAPVLTADTLAAGLLQHAGKHDLAVKSYGEQIAANARTLRCNSLVDACRLALRLEGREEPVGGVNALLKAAFSTVSLPNALGDSMSKTLTESFKSYPATWRAVALKRSNSDFKSSTSIRPGAIRKLQPLPPDGEIKHDAPSEDVFTTKLETFAGMIAITRQDIINDDLGFFDSIPAGLARAAAQAVNDEFAETWMLNGTHFTLARGNYFEGAASALSATSLATAIKMLRSMTDDKGSPVDMQPRTLLVPPSLEGTALALVQSEYLQVATGPTGNPYREAVEVVVEPRLENANYSGFSATAWYLVAPVSEAPALAAFLNGNESPTIETDDTAFNTLGQQWRAYIDVDFSLGEYRAAVKSKGSA
jgi:hypothetical protein